MGLSVSARPEMGCNFACLRQPQFCAHVLARAAEKAVGMRFITFGGYVPLAPPNPYPVSDQHFVEF